VAQDDQLAALDGVELTQPAQVAEILARHRPGDQLPLRVIRRSGERFDTSVTLAEDQRIEVVPVEQTGQALTDEMRRFRAQWIGVRP
jgi:PDZ domain-containing secreted protein